MAANELGHVNANGEEREPLRSSIVELRGAPGARSVGPGSRQAPAPARSRVRVVSPDVQRLQLVHDLYGDLARVFTRGADDVEAAEPAYLCAAASAWAFAGPDALVDVMYRLGLGENGRCESIGIKNSALSLDFQVNVLSNVCRDIVVLAFRGPRHRALVARLMGDQQQGGAAMPDGRGQVYRMFLCGLLPLWEPLCAVLQEPHILGRRVYMTGYGMGGALALLAGARLAAHGLLGKSSRIRPTLQGIHTFGQPRLGDAELATWVEELVGERTYRYVVEGDPMPDLPNPLAGMHHAGRECRLQDGRWQMVRTGPQGNGAALLGLIKQTGRGVVRRMVNPQRAILSSPHGGMDAYLRGSRNAVDRALVFP